jgi:hypothetical protein
MSMHIRDSVRFQILTQASTKTIDFCDVITICRRLQTLQPKELLSLSEKLMKPAHASVNPVKFSSARHHIPADWVNIRSRLSFLIIWRLFQ